VSAEVTFGPETHLSEVAKRRTNEESFSWDICFYLPCQQISVNLQQLLVCFVDRQSCLYEAQKLEPYPS